MASVPSWRVIHGEALATLQQLAGGSFDALVTDPPAGVSFMGREWDSDKGGRDCWIAWLKSVMAEGLRTLKPGAHALVWALPRTSHWTATALEDAGFEIRDICHHHFGSGFPKSQDVGKFMDQLAGAEREVVGQHPNTRHYGLNKTRVEQGYRKTVTVGDGTITAPATEAAKQWSGWGSALKPASEHWILARKPLSETSIARNVLKHGTGALNIDGCRVERAEDDVPGWHKTGANGSAGYQNSDTFAIRAMTAGEVQARCGDKGRWPANLVLSHSETCRPNQCAMDCPVAEIDRQSGGSRSRRGKPRRSQSPGDGYGMVHTGAEYDDAGSASRFFPTFRYQAKPSRSEREAGLEKLPERILNRVNAGGLENEPRFAPISVKNNHPTVKSTALMAWLIRLITPPGGAVLDPFCGSGSTGCAAVRDGFSFLGIEQEESYCEMARARMEYWAGRPASAGSNKGGA